MSNLARTTTRLARSLSLHLPSQRSFTSSSISMKDFVQELYLRELKSYKPSPSIMSTQNQVREFTMPPTPSAPVLPTSQDVAQELQSWDSASLTGVEIESSQSADEFLTFLERDHPTPAAHH
ncbi:ATP synthase complex subunit H-domain-containing protein [Melampsora americana]|nr:ATP synthase complex subunit H-domain-containing protein [Melampsora americana]